MLSRPLLRAARGGAVQRALRNAQLHPAIPILGSRSISVSACDSSPPPETPVVPVPSDEQIQAGWQTATTPVGPDVAAVTEAPAAYIPTYADSSWMGPFDGMELLLETLHTTSGLEWPVVIVGLTVGVRTLMLPIIVDVMKNTQRMQRIHSQVQAISGKMQAVASTDPALVHRYQKEMKDLFAANNCHPLRSVRGILFQAPVFMSFFFAIRRIAEADPSFAATSFLWCPDMSLADPTFILPVATGVTMLATVELGADGQQMQENPMAKYALRAMAVAVVPFTAYFPSGLFCYWVTSNVFSLAQLGVLKFPPIRDALGLLPPMPPKVAPEDRPVKFVETKPVADPAVASPKPRNTKRHQR